MKNFLHDITENEIVIVLAAIANQYTVLESNYLHVHPSYLDIRKDIFIDTSAVHLKLL